MGQLDTVLQYYWTQKGNGDRSRNLPFIIKKENYLQATPVGDVIS
jgi:hypothetical protein